MGTAVTFMSWDTSRFGFDFKQTCYDSGVGNFWMIGPFEVSVQYECDTIDLLLRGL